MPGWLEQRDLRRPVADHAGQDLQRTAFDIAASIERGRIEAHQVAQIAGRQPLEDDPVGGEVGVRVLRGSRVMREPAAGQHDRAPAEPLQRMRERPAEGETALGRRLRRNVRVNEHREERHLARIAAEIEGDREGGAEFGVERKGRVEAEIEELPHQRPARLAVDRPPAFVPTAALGARPAMDRKGRDAAHHEIIAMGVRDHDHQIGIERAEAVAQLAHRRVDPGNLRLVLGLGQGEELRGMRHDRPADDAGTGFRGIIHGSLA
jgi:hypothetical protein